MHQIRVSDLVVDVVRKDIKNMHLAVYPPGGRVRVAVPLLVVWENHSHTGRPRRATA